MYCFWPHVKPTVSETPPQCSGSMTESRGLWQGMAIVMGSVEGSKFCMGLTFIVASMAGRLKNSPKSTPHKGRKRISLQYNRLRRLSLNSNWEMSLICSVTILWVAHRACIKLKDDDVQFWGQWALSRRAGVWHGVKHRLSEMLTAEMLGGWSRLWYSMRPLDCSGPR